MGQMQISDADIDAALVPQAQQPPTKAEPREPVPIVDGKVQVSTLEAAYRAGSFLLQTNMLPKGVDTQAQATMMLLTGMELGLTLAATLQNVAIINGVPRVWGDAALAVVRRREDAGEVHETIEGQGDDMVAKCSVERWHAKADRWETVTRTFSVADAKTAGLWGKTGYNGKPTPWVTHPKRMLQMRARSLALRDAFADAIMCGIVEEHEPEAIEGPKIVARKAGETLGDALAQEDAQ